MAKNEGYLSFFRGSWLRVIRIAPGMFKKVNDKPLSERITYVLSGGAIQFAVYEQVAAWLDKANPSTH